MLRFIDSMQQNGANNPWAAPAGKWDSAGASAYVVNPGRYPSTYAVGVDFGDRGTTKTLPVNMATAIVGCGVRFAGLPTTAAPNPNFELWDANTRQISLGAGTDGLLRVYRGAPSGGTLLGTGTKVLTNSAWYFVEIKVVFATGATGSVTVRVNGVNDIVLTNVQTAASANAWCNKVGLGGLSNTSSASTYFQDLYIADATGTVNLDFLGDVRVELRVPTGDGGQQQFATVLPNTATHWPKVSEIPHDADTSYVEDATVGNTETYTKAALTTATGAVFGVQFIPVVKRTDAGAKTIAGIFRTGAVNYPGALKQPSTTYDAEQARDIMETNPATAAAWTIADVNGGEFGFKVGS